VPDIIFVVVVLRPIVCNIMSCWKLQFIKGCSPDFVLMGPLLVSITDTCYHAEDNSSSIAVL